MKHNQNKSHKGFTLIEMLGVLAIIAILISVIAVGVLSAINRAAIVATASNCKNLETAVVGFVALPASGGTIPLTEGAADPAETGATGPIKIVTVNTVAAGVPDDGSYTLTQALIATGLIDRQMSWRVGRDGANYINSAVERTFRVSKNAFNSVADDATATGNIAQATVNRAEAAIVDHDAITAADGPVGGTWAGSNGLGTGTGVDFLLDGVNGLQASRCAYVVLQNVSIKDACALSRELNGNFDDTDKPTFRNNPGTTFQARGRFVFAAPAATTDTTVTCYYYLASF